MNALPFLKMHGLGNDFVVLDARRKPLALNAGQVRAIADRRTGVGCDQLIVIEPPAAALADAFMRIRNADGGEVAACGNASRCVASLLMAEKNTEHVIIETAAGLLDAEARGDGLVGVDMGRVSFDWRDIPLSKPADTLHLDVAAGPLRDGVAVNVGNPHAVYFVADAAAAPLEAVGPIIENHTMFPERTNVEVAEVLGPDRIRLRVWERGVGITRACGSGACATLVAAARRGLTGRSAEVVLDGGRLSIEWLKDDHVLMTGPVATSFTGTIDAALLAR
ncbi:MAG: diaminopimelate epimerase [Rhodospirillales bacterium]|nr:diaminopimelate epimerase [Rhodospirillales bacterium]